MPFLPFVCSNIKGMGFMCVCVSVFLETTHFMSFMLGNVLEVGADCLVLAADDSLLSC